MRRRAWLPAKTGYKEADEEIASFCQLRFGTTFETFSKIEVNGKNAEPLFQFLKENGEIYFKTDDDNLFNDSISYFKSSGFEIIKNTYDLQDEPEFWDNIKTEHEDMFTEQGIKIKALIAKVITN